MSEASITHEDVRTTEDVVEGEEKMEEDIKEEDTKDNAVQGGIRHKKVGEGVP